jgi:hypothetical protein
MPIRNTDPKNCYYLTADEVLKRLDSDICDYLFHVLLHYYKTDIYDGNKLNVEKLKMYDWNNVIEKAFNINSYTENLNFLNYLKRQYSVGNCEYLIFKELFDWEVTFKLINFISENTRMNDSDVISAIQHYSIDAFISLYPGIKIHKDRDYMIKKLVKHIEETKEDVTYNRVWLNDYPGFDLRPR